MKKHLLFIGFILASFLMFQVKVLNADALNILPKLVEMKNKKDINASMHYWRDEINNGKKMGKFYVYKYPVSDNEDLVFSMMKAPIACNTLGEKYCLVKIVAQNNKSGDYKVVYDQLYFNLKKDALYLEKGKESEYPLIKAWKFVFEYDKDKKQYDYTKDSPRPKVVEVMDPRGFDPNSDVENTDEKKDDILDKKSENKYFEFFKNVKDVFASLFITPVYASSCPAMINPSTGPITSKFGYRTLGGKGNDHRGVDYGISSGTKLPAISGGTVITVRGHCGRDNGSLGNDCEGGYGNWVAIKLDNGVEVRYAHLNEVSVKVGQRVDAGTIIGLSGHTGNSTGPHLHFEIRVDGKPVEPLSYLKDCRAGSWDGTGDSGDSGNVNDPLEEEKKYMIENLPWYVGGDDMLSDERYNELFGDDQSCLK